MKVKSPAYQTSAFDCSIAQFRRTKENHLPVAAIRSVDQLFRCVQKIPFVQFLRQLEALHHICNTTFVEHEEALL